MTKILLVSKEKTTFEKLAIELIAYQENQVRWVPTSKEATQLALDKKVDVVIAGKELEDTDGLACIQLIAQNCPLINCALMSTLSADEFHETTEGFGVFLQLPEHPDKEDAEKIMHILQSISVLLAK